MPRSPVVPKSSTPTRAREGRPLRPGLKVGLGLLSLAVTLLLAEGLLRLLPIPVPELRNLEHLRGFYELDEQSRIQTRPGWRGVITVDGPGIPAQTNSLGLRGPEVEVGPATRRILFVGDSFTWGMGVSRTNTIPSRVQQFLLDDGHDVCCGNAGMYGTGPREWSYTVERHRQGFGPDAIVAICYAGNDLADTLSPPLTVIDGWALDGATAAKARTAWRFNLALRSRVWMYLEWMVLLPMGLPIGGAGLDPDPILPPGLSAYEGYFFDVAEAFSSQAPYIAAVEQRMADSFRSFREACGDTPALIVVLPGREASSRDMWRQGLGKMLAGAGLTDRVDAFQRGAGAHRVARIAVGTGLPVLDLTEPILSLEDPDAIYLSDYHYNQDGCRKVAEWLRAPVGKLLPP